MYFNLSQNVIVAALKDITKLKTATTVTIQYSTKLHNIADDSMKLAWYLPREYSNTTQVNSRLAVGKVGQADGWVTFEESGIILPDLTDFAKVWIKTRVEPVVDFLLDNVNIIIDI